MTQHDRERAEAMEALRSFYPKGSTVYTILRHVSRSGMQRTIGLVSMGERKNGDDGIRHPNWSAAKALGLRVDRERDGVKIGGCGMDMGFSIAYNLGRILYNDGKALNHRWL